MTSIWKSAHTVDHSELRADVVVVGSGPSGQAVARQLAASGIDVLILEAGPAETVHRKSQALLQAAMPAVHGQYPDFGTHLLMNLGGAIGKPQMPMSPDGSKPAEGIRLTRLVEADFAAWPFDVDELAPYYREISDWFGIDWEERPTPRFADPRLQAEPFHVVSRRRFSHPTPRQLGDVRVLLDAPVSRLIVESTGRIASALVATTKGRTMRVEADRFVLAMNSMPATQLLLHSRAAMATGMLGHFLMDHPLTTLGYIEPSADLPREILESLTPAPTDTGLYWPKLVPDQSAVAADRLVNLALTLIPLDWSVRRNLARHRFLKPVRVGARTGAKHRADRLKRAAHARRFDRATAADALAAARGIDELLHIKFRPKGPRFNMESGWWQHELRASLPRTFEIMAMVEQKPRWENHVSLSDETNDLGWKKLRVNWRYSDEDKDRVDLAATPIIDALEDAGFGRFTRLPSSRHTENYSCHHASGTIRMAATPAHGVVDPNCRTFEHENLYVVGAAVFPSIGYANPTLTTMALGARVADHILKT
jgi:choline dehydrogenase-like flavoprotein